MKNTFVGFFDILGFKTLVEKNQHKDLIDIYNVALYETLDMTDDFYDKVYPLLTPESEKGSLSIKTFVISDSIILLQEDLTRRGLLYLIAKSQILLSTSLAEGIPLRGAISFGPITTFQNKRGTTIVGQGLTKAYSLEASQQWSGGIVDKECFNLFPEINGTDFIKTLLNDKVNPLIIKYNIPLKDSKYKVGYGFNWPKYNLIKSKEDVALAFTKHKKEISSDKERLIIQNTLDYYGHVKKLIGL